ncbi:hypothetical protein HETIRDRAFT_436109 [Heterobasidion irregulare TC 32-1]|uniref:Uncharacterized protein n=1 Tax=Heterobasidion irregulare (strain TC 32-1) TaxID=747525 RepID=W4JVT8_HETIT|nr:uncharacterized protein HETIRDRAFT_436109 [Heterobasidion irregulare TC 32-1]ETW76981.1 hypothetical protein HETIRDRAFT_436109 [Heterobasidion irregulare TC 32-1]
MHPALCSDALHAFECVNKEDKGKLAAERQDGKGRADCYEALKPTHLGPRCFTVSRPTSRPSTSRTAATHCPSTDGDPCPRPHLRPHSLPSAPPERTLPDDTQRIAAVRVWTRRMRPSWWYIVISYSRCTLVRSSSHPLLLDPVDLLARRSQPARSLSCSTHSAPRPLARVLYVPSAHRPRGRFRLGLISAPTLVSSTPLTAAYSSSQTPRRSVPRTPNCRLPADRTRRLVEDKEWLEGRYEVGRGLKRTTRTCTMDGNSLSKPGSFALSRRWVSAALVL